MALFDAHSKKGIGQDPCVQKKQCPICDNLSEDQKKQLATPTYRAQKELQKKASSLSLSVDPTDVMVLGKVEGKGDSNCDRGETPSKKSQEVLSLVPHQEKSRQSHSRLPSSPEING